MIPRGTPLRIISISEFLSLTFLDFYFFCSLEEEELCITAILTETFFFLRGCDVSPLCVVLATPTRIRTRIGRRGIRRGMIIHGTVNTMGAKPG